ncbi:hypothetical protein KK141_22540 [Dyella sp. LX-66]|uniref:hypothetical protein n=1 Tax=unclassified Dyella TaxID=2634549 RepID=UPI001BDF82D8|nr:MULTISPECIES: hypothetical protein [unclassified Dyella]MBT2119832.1 hypothetical protein [Dyella sp. LX-1]MBT2142341.1 hypothetical protein [Dyella sp. LX-66]
MSDNELPPEDLISEKRMGQVFLKSLRLQPSKFNLIVTLLSFVGFLVDGFLSKSNYVLMADFVRSFTALGLNVAFSVLAFLIAGFTVFATMTERSLFMAKAIMRDPESGLSFLKRDMFLVMRFFGYLLAYIFICLAFLLFSRKGGVIYSIIKMADLGDDVRQWFVVFAYVAFSTISVFVILQVKSFIFNVYHLVMSSILWGFKNPQKKGGG